MKIIFDPAKRDKTIIEKGLDFARAGDVFAGVTVTMEDNRQDYRETRCITVGYLGNRIVVIVWTPRGDARRIISMRKVNEREIAKCTQELG